MIPSSRSKTSPIDLREMYSAYYRWRRLGIVIVLATLLGVQVGNYLHYPIFESTVKILVERSGGAALPFSHEQIAFRKSEITETQAQLMTSKPVLEEVARRLCLVDRPEPSDSLRYRVHAAWDRLLGKIDQWKQGCKKFFVERLLGGHYSPPIPPDLFRETVDTLAANVRSESLSNTDVLVLTVRDYDAEVAARIANTIAAVYIERELAYQKIKAREVYELITTQMEALRPRYEEAEQAVREFDRINQARWLKDQIRTQLEEASRLEISYRELLEGQDSRLLTLKLEVARLEKVYSADHPKVLAARSELAKGEQALASPTASRAAGAELDRSGRADSMLNRIREVRDGVRKLTDLEAQYARLVETRDREEKLFSDLRTKREDAAVAEATRTAGPQIFEPGLAAGKPSYPRKRLNLLLGLAGALLAAALICGLREFLDHSIKTPVDVAKILANAEVWSIPDWRRPGAWPRRWS